MADAIDLENWAKEKPKRSIPENAHYRVRLWDGDGFDDKRVLDVSQPSGQKVLETFERFPTDEYILMLLDRTGLHIVELNENIDLSGRGAERFFAFNSDRTHNVSVDGRREPWGEGCISGEMLRLIFKIEDNKDLILARKDVADQKMEDTDFVDLEEPGLERLFTKLRGWELNVQGVTILSMTSEIVVSDALVQAGFDPNDGWVAILKIAGQPRNNVLLTDTIDLSNPGIEKLRLRPNEIKNGEVLPVNRREFRLLEKDEKFLNQRGLSWESIIEGGRRWLLIRSFVLPQGYNVASADIAIDVPATYPAAEIDMFFCMPHLNLQNGGEPPQTQVRVSIEGKNYQQWSRHLCGVTRWNPRTDSVISHLALVEESLFREVATT